MMLDALEHMAKVILLPRLQMPCFLDAPLHLPSNSQPEMLTVPLGTGARVAALVAAAARAAVAAGAAAVVAAMLVLARRVKLAVGTRAASVSSNRLTAARTFSATSVSFKTGTCCGRETPLSMKRFMMTARGSTGPTE